MTNEEAIKILKFQRGYFCDLKGCEEHQAFTMAIKALEQEPCADAISRQIISDYVESHIQEINTGYGDLNKHTNEILRMIVDYIESMPPVTPQPKTGHWRHYEGMLICSECGSEFYDDIMEYCGDDVPKCCPNCGAKME